MGPPPCDWPGFGYSPAMTDLESHRATAYWRSLLTRVAEDFESMASRETDPARAKLLSARAMRIRQRLFEGVPKDFDSSPNRPPLRFE